MTDDTRIQSPVQTPARDAREAEDMGEKPDLGHTADTLAEALTGTDSGSDTRAGSLRGGSASGSEEDPDQAAINRSLAEQGEASAQPRTPSSVGSEPVKNTGAGPGDPADGPEEGQPGDDADAATG